MKKRKMVNRKLNITELNMIDKMLDQCAFDPTNLYTQVRSATVCNINDDGSIIRFEHPPSARRAPAPPIHFVPVEALAKDTDGGTIHVLLHIRDGKVYELEYLKEDSSIIKKWPQADDLIDFVVIK